jgi:hypothetical protein
MQGKGGNRDQGGGVWLHLGGLFARCPIFMLLGRSNHLAPCDSLLGGAWSQLFPIIVQGEPQLLLKGPETLILCCLSCCHCCLEGSGHRPSQDHRYLSCCLCLHRRSRCSARSRAKGSEGCSCRCLGHQCSCLTNRLACRFANYKPQGSEGYYYCHCNRCTGGRAANWLRRSLSCGSLTATRPRRRKKTTSCCWRAIFLQRTQDGTLRVDCRCLQGN